MVLAADDLHGGKAEEVGSGVTDDQLPFVEITELLTTAGLPVPIIDGWSSDEGVLIMEDLGSLHLADCFTDGISPLDHYRAALDQLVVFQSSRFPPESVIARRGYGFDLWLWEFEHFVEYGIEARQGIEPSSYPRTELMSSFADLSRMIAECPRVPVHRDFHSRNLLIKKGQVRWIDYQDALMGPALYDVASLLFDAYVNIDEVHCRELFSGYLSQARERSVPVSDHSEELLNVIAVQRMLKAAGRFVYFRDVKGLSGYVEHIPGLMKRVAGIVTNLDGQVPALDRAFALMLPLVPEWAGG